MAEDVRSLGPPDTSGTSVLIRFLSVLERENFSIMQINQDNRLNILLRTSLACMLMNNLFNYIDRYYYQVDFRQRFYYF